MKCATGCCRVIHSTKSRWFGMHFVGASETCVVASTVCRVGDDALLDVCHKVMTLFGVCRIGAEHRRWRLWSLLSTPQPRVRA